MAVTANFGWAKPADREQFLENLLQQILDDMDSDLSLSVRVSHSAAQSIPNNAWTSLAFNTEAHDRGGFHDTAVNNSRLTVPAAGVYAGRGQVVFAASSAGNVRGVRGRVNGVNTNLVGIHQQGVFASFYTVVDVSLAAALYAQGNYVELQAYQDSGGALSTVADAAAGFFSTMSLWRVG